MFIGGDKENFIYVSFNVVLSVEGDSVKFVVYEVFESVLFDVMVDIGVKNKDILYFVLFKYVYLIELMCNGLKDGK